MVETIQQMQAVNTSPNIPFIIVGEWTTRWARMPSSIDLTKPTKPKEVPSTFSHKFIFVEEIFQDINK